jgi:hypothetical protein
LKLSAPYPKLQLPEQPMFQLGGVWEALSDRALPWGARYVFSTFVPPSDVRPVHLGVRARTKTALRRSGSRSQTRCVAGSRHARVKHACRRSHEREENPCVYRQICVVVEGVPAVMVGIVAVDVRRGGARSDTPIVCRTIANGRAHLPQIMDTV